MKPIDYKKFFSFVRAAPFGGRLTQLQVDGTKSIIQAFLAAGGTDERHLAYILATAFHETGGRMVPVREGFKSSDAAARAHVKRYFPHYAVAGSGALGIFSSINSPWAFAAFAILALGAFLFLTGRIKIVKQAGA